MNKEELAFFRNLLLEREKEILDAINKTDSSLHSEYRNDKGVNPTYAFHLADLGTDTIEKEKQYHLSSKARRLLYHLHEAIMRIDKGEYGVCETCGIEIRRERLKVVPHARLCIKCKEKEENGQGSK